MRQISFTASVLVSFLRSGISALVTFLGPSWDGPDRRYHPEDHYMRGPGPKWRKNTFAHPPAAREFVQQSTFSIPCHHGLVLTMRDR